MLIVMELRESPKEIWLNWKKKLGRVWKMCMVVGVTPFFSSPNATDSDLGGRPLASLPFRRPTALSFGLADI